MEHSGSNRQSITNKASTLAVVAIAAVNEDFDQRTVPAGFSQTVVRQTDRGALIALQGTTIWAAGQFAHITHLREQSASTQPHDLVLQTLAFTSFSLVGNWSAQGSGLTLRQDGTYDRYFIRGRGVFETRDRGRYRIDDKTVILQTDEGKTICSLTFRDGKLIGCGSSYDRN